MDNLKSIGARPQGRPRSEKSRQAVLGAAMELLEHDGLGTVTVEAIAARAGVSKVTIYRWWPNKAAVVTDAFLELAAPEIEFGDSGSVSEDLRDQMRRFVRALNGKTGRTITAIMAESQTNREAVAAFRERWIAKRREATRVVLRRGIERGELRADLDLDVAMDAIYGPIYYRLFIGHAPLEESFADALAEHVLAGLVARKNS